MRILILTTSFSLEPGDGNLINDLANELVALGHEVEVVLVDWNATPNGPSRRIASAPRLNVLAVSPRSLQGFGRFIALATKWLASSRFARREMKRNLPQQNYDLMIGFSMACISLSQIVYAQQQSRHSYLIQWDFFPYHHRSIGLITNPILFKLTLWLETWSMRPFDVIGCMTPANETYLKSHYTLRKGQKTEILPIWGPTDQAPLAPRAAVRAAFDLPAGNKIVVFGGQLTEGRGLDDIIAAAELSRELYPDLLFLIIGDGRLACVIEQVSRNGSNITYRKRIPRENYLELLTACDAGLVCTVRNVDVPTFPSKTIDYLRAGIPIVASVESSTDYGTYIESKGLGAASLAGDPGALAATAARVVGDAALAAAIRDRARACLESDFDVRKVAQRLLHVAAEGAARA